MNKLNQFKKFRHSLTPLLILGTLVMPLVHAETTWPDWNNPHYFLFPGETLETHFDALKLHSSVVEAGGHIPYSDTYWPDDDIGIATRYSDVNDKPTVQKTRSDVVREAVRPGLEALKKLSIQELNTFSPTEKFDIANGDYDYPLTMRVVKSLDGKEHFAYGICHGWSAASSHYGEPEPVLYTNKDGLVIPFGASDVKAIMAFYYAWEVSEFNEKKDKEHKGINENWGYKTDANGNKTYWQKEPGRVYFDYRQVGSRCYSNSIACKNNTINAGAFYLSLTNLVGRFHLSFEVDAHNGPDIWNYPVFGYASEILSVKKEDPSDSNNMAVKRVEMKTDLYFTEITAPQHATTNGTIDPANLPPGFERLGLSLNQLPGAIGYRHLVYYLYLDSDGNVVDGDWRGNGIFVVKSKKNDPIGFIWRTTKVPFTGKYSILNQIYQTKQKD